MAAREITLNLVGHLRLRKQSLTNLSHIPNLQHFAENMFCLINNNRRVQACTHPPNFLHQKVSCYPKCVYFEGNCIRLSGEIPSPPVGPFGRLAPRPSARSINVQAGGRLRYRKVSGGDITHVVGDLLSEALILKRLNNRDRLWTRKE